MNISPSNIFQNILLAERFHQNCVAVLAAVSIKSYLNCHLDLSFDNNLETNNDLTEYLKKSCQ